MREITFIFKVTPFYLFYFNELYFFNAVVRLVMIQPYALVLNKNSLYVHFMALSLKGLY